MKIESIKIGNFRNAQSINFEPCDGVNVIYGDNAQGKTNILEAVWLFSGARSFRSSKESDFIRFGSDRAGLELNFFAKGRSQTASIFISGNKKTASLNEIKLSGAGRLAGEFCIVFFSPDHLLLVKQGPEHRRKMIDFSLCQAYPKYARILESYQKIIKQRAFLLRDIAKNSSLLDMLDVWDQSLVEYGAYITWIRQGYVKKLGLYAEEIYRGISGGREKLGLAYRSSFAENNSCFDRAEYAKCFGSVLRSNRSADIALGKTTAGPHRDDLEINIDGVSARNFGSQGQQRSCVLALKLAECGILEERSGEPPVILLDDVMSELDHSRRSYLLNRLDGKQVIITCCDHMLYKGLNGGGVFFVENGELERGLTG